MRKEEEELRGVEREREVLEDFGADFVTNKGGGEMSCRWDGEEVGFVGLGSGADLRRDAKELGALTGSGVRGKRVGVESVAMTSVVASAVVVVGDGG